MRDLLRTERTYKSRDGAMRALLKATVKENDQLQYLIAVNEDGRFAPVVVPGATQKSRHQAWEAFHSGVATIVGG